MSQDSGFGSGIHSQQNKYERGMIFPTQAGNGKITRVNLDSPLDTLFEPGKMLSRVVPEDEELYSQRRKVSGTFFFSTKNDDGTPLGFFY